MCGTAIVDTRVTACKCVRRVSVMKFRGWKARCPQGSGTFRCSLGLETIRVHGAGGCGPPGEASVCCVNCSLLINQSSINVKFVGRRYTTRPSGAPTVVSGKHDHKVHS